MFKSTIEYLVRSVGSVISCCHRRATSQGRICGCHECDLLSPELTVVFFSLFLFFDWEIMTRFRNLLEHRQQLLLQLTCFQDFPRALQCLSRVFHVDVAIKRYEKFKTRKNKPVLSDNN